MRIVLIVGYVLLEFIKRLYSCKLLVGFRFDKEVCGALYTALRVAAWFTDGYPRLSCQRSRLWWRLETENDERCVVIGAWNVRMLRNTIEVEQIRNVYE